MRQRIPIEGAWQFRRSRRGAAARAKCLVDRSEVKDNVAGENQLALFRSCIISRRIISVFESQFGTNQDGGAEPVPPADEMFGVLRPEAGSLPLVPGLPVGMPRVVDLVIPGGVVGLNVVISVLSGIRRIIADIDIVPPGMSGVADAGVERGFGVRLPNPQRDIVSRR
jgi:hypothetical protein